MTKRSLSWLTAGMSLTEHLCSFAFCITLPQVVIQAVVVRSVLWSLVFGFAAITFAAAFLQLRQLALGRLSRLHCARCDGQLSNPFRYEASMHDSVSFRRCIHCHRLYDERIFHG